MGLDAIVYSNAARLSGTYGDDRVKVDQATGEVFPKDGEELSIPADVLVAARERLGNIDEIRFLRAEVQKLFGDADSLLIQKVLYSASHSGDIIAVSDIQLLCKELDVLRDTNNPELQAFVAAMDSLIRASSREHNPIVFV